MYVAGINGNKVNTLTRVNGREYIPLGNSTRVVVLTPYKLWY